MIKEGKVTIGVRVGVWTECEGAWQFIVGGSSFILPCMLPVI